MSRRTSSAVRPAHFLLRKETAVLGEYVNEADSHIADGSLKSINARGRSIAAILVASGRLSEENSEIIKKKQQETHQQFEECGMALGLIQRSDVTFALSRQFEYPFPTLRDSSVSKELAVAYRPFSDLAEALRSVRSRLLINWLDGNASAGQAFAVVSPLRGEGRSWITANLAVLFSQLGERTLVIDCDLRNPRQHSLFGIQNKVGLSNMIAGLAGIEAVQQIKDFPDLAVLPAGVSPPNPQEILSRIEFGMLMQRLRHEFDVILMDTPALDEVADAETVASRAGNALFVARRNKSKLSLLDHYCDLLQKSSVRLLGSVMLD